MDFLLYQLKVALFFLAVYIFFRLLLVKETLHALNRAVLLLSILLSAVLPLCVITVHVDATASFASLLRSGSDAASLDTDTFNWTLLLLCAYALGVLAVLVSVLIASAADSQGREASAAGWYGHSPYRQGGVSDELDEVHNTLQGGLLF